jgi:hypothetical protein
MPCVFLTQFFNLILRENEEVFEFILAKPREKHQKFQKTHPRLRVYR